MENINSTINLYRHIKKNNRVAIDVFFAARVARQKGLRTSALVSRLRKKIVRAWGERKKSGEIQGGWVKEK